MWIRGAEIAEDIILVLIIATAALLFSIKLNSHFTLPKITVSCFLIAALQVPLLIRMRMNACHRIHGWIVSSFIGLILWWLIATTQALHLQTALEGQYGRYNALYTNLMLMALFFALANMRLTTKRIRRIMLIGLLVLMPVCLFAFFQYLGLDTVFQVGFGARPHSSIGNPVALATVLLLFLPFAMMFVTYPGKLQQHASYALITLILLATILITGSRGPWAGALASILLMGALGMSLSRNMSLIITRRNITIALVCIVIIGFILNLETVRSRFSLGAGFDIRWMYYTISLDVIKDSPLFGFGFESFRQLYPEYRPEYDWQLVQNTTPTMIHNDYLQLSADNGLPALLFYILFIGSIIWGLFRLLRIDTADKQILIAMLAAIFGYLVQANFGWLEAGSLITYWLILGLSAGYLTSHQPEPSLKCVGSYRYAITGFTIVGILFCLFYGVLMSGKIMTDYSLRQAQQYIYTNFDLAESYAANVDTATQENFYYQDRLGLLYIKRQTRFPNKENYEKARNHLFRSAALNLHDAYIHLHIMENDIIAIQQQVIQRPSAEAVTAAREAVRIDPNNPSTHRVAATIYGLNDQPEEQQKHLKRMKELQEFDWEGVDEREILEVFLDDGSGSNKTRR